MVKLWTKGTVTLSAKEPGARRFIALTLRWAKAVVECRFWHYLQSLPLWLQVVAAGSPQQVADAMKDAEQYKEPLMERAVLVVPLPIYEGDAVPQESENSVSSSTSSAEQTKEDLR